MSHQEANQLRGGACWGTARGSVKPYSFQDVLSAPPVARMTTQLECARLADGAACVLVVADDWWVARHSSPSTTLFRSIRISGSGEASGPLDLLPSVAEEPISHDGMFGARVAANLALREAGIERSRVPEDIQWFGLYDCFPVCGIKAIEDVGLARDGDAPRLLRTWLESTESDRSFVAPVNTHGGLLAMGAPANVPALFSVVEAILQFRGESPNQIRGDVSRALVYGNGGVFSHSAVVIIERQMPASARAKL
jgi:acetyl-CoA acetyltransferase